MTSDTSLQPNAETKVMRLRYAGEEAFVAESASGHAIVTSFSHDQMSAPSPMELVLIALGGWRTAMRFSSGGWSPSSNLAIRGSDPGGGGAPAHQCTELD